MLSRFIIIFLWLITAFGNDLTRWPYPFDKSKLLIHELEIKQIPRYILLDAKGKVIHENLPKPSSGQLEVLIDKLLQHEKD